MLATYCFIDDFLKASGHNQDIRVYVYDAEVVAIAPIAMLYFDGNFERSRLVLFELGLRKRTLNRSQLNGRLHQESDRIEAVFTALVLVLKDLNWESRYLIDSFPVALCDNIRINSSRIV